MTFSDLLTALQNTGIPFAEGGWNRAPDATVTAYGGLSVVSEGNSIWASNEANSRVFLLACDLFVRGSNGRTEMAQVEEVLADADVSWDLTSVMNERSNSVIHYSWNVEVHGL